MVRYKYITKMFLILCCCSMFMGCQKAEDVAVEQVTAEETQILDRKNEMVIAVNVDGSATELPFESVWMNRSKFWGSLVFQGLLIADQNISNVNPDLCEEYIISTDGKKYTFILKDNLKWHDGVALTADDIVWSIETYLKVQETNGFVKKGLQEIQGVEQFEKGISNYVNGISVRGREITIVLKEENPAFLAAIAQLAILPKHCLEEVPIEEFTTCDFWNMPIGSGPYKIITNVDNKDAVLVVNQDYSGRIPDIKQIRYKVLKNPAVDSFDVTISSDPVTINNFDRNPRYEVIKTNNLYYRYLMFNLDERTGENEGLLQNAKIRKALMLAIDKEGILDEIYDGAALTIDGGVPEYDSWYVAKTDSSYNPALAEQILKEEGYDFSKTLVLTRYSLDELSEKLLQRIAECWEEIGISVEIIPIEKDSTNKLFVEADWYDVALKNLSAVDYTEWYFEYSDENPLWSVILNNRHEFHDVIQSINRATFANELQSLYAEIQLLENELVYKIPLAIVPQYVIYNKQNIHVPDIAFPNLWYYYDLDIADWTIVE